MSLCQFISFSFLSFSNIFSILDGRQAVDIKDIKDRKVVLSKSDGATLYINCNFLSFSLSVCLFVSFSFLSVSNIFSISDGRQAVDVKDRKVVLSKSDGSMLYKTCYSLSFFVCLSVCFSFLSISNIFSISDGWQAVEVNDQKVVLSKSDGSTLYIIFNYISLFLYVCLFVSFSFLLFLIFSLFQMVDKPSR